MATLVGLQGNYAEALKELLELDYDAAEAYRAAIARVDDASYKMKLEEFLKDHERHIEELTKLLKNHNEEVPDGPSLKQYLTKGKIYLADTIGDDKTILNAMITNEDDTNSAYERMSAREDHWEDAKDIIKRGFEDEKRHKEWLKNTISS